MSVSAMNYKPMERGALLGFFDLRYHGLTIKGAKLVKGKHGMFIGLPQVKGEQDGEVRYFDQMFLTAPEMEHVRRLVLAELEAQGHVARQERPARTSAPRRPAQTRRTPEGEDVSDYYPNGHGDDDIPF